MGTVVIVYLYISFLFNTFLKTPRGNGYVTDSLWLSEEVIERS